MEQVTERLRRLSGQGPGVGALEDDAGLVTGEHGVPVEGAEIARRVGVVVGDEFVDRLDANLAARGVATKRYRKPTNTRVAPTELIQDVALESGWGNEFLGLAEQFDRAAGLLGWE